MNTKYFLLYLLLISCVSFIRCTQSNASNNLDTNDDQVESNHDYNRWKIENGRFYKNGKWEFLKIAKPLANYGDANAVKTIMNSLTNLKAKKYNTVSINCYWHHFDKNGDGILDVSTTPLKQLINQIYALGMYPVLSVETYSVGGGQMPEGFWSIYPDADAVDQSGKTVVDSEYGFGSRVVSIFHEGYRKNARTFIKNLTKEVDHKKILYFETTVEPQYMGILSLCYSKSAKDAYNKWLTQNQITNVEAQMPNTFPIPQKFIENETWNRFRAEFLAQWVNEDAKAFREIAGEKANIAVDYLDAGEESMRFRCGNPEVFLDHLTEATIIQVNWSWYFPENKPNKKAYDRVRAAMKKNNCDWAITEHMTFNGSDFMNYSELELRNILQNTIDSSTQFGWEFVSVMNNTMDSFSMYNNDWSPKRPMALVDNYWLDWLNKIYSKK